MAGVRRAFAWATFARYVVMAANLGATLATARMVAPGDYGVSVLGGSAYTIAEALRELGGGAYLIQHRDISPAQIRTSITTSVLVTLAVAFVLAAGAGGIARFYNSPDVETYLRVTALAYLLGPLIFPILALMSREMAFDSLALVTVSMAAANGATCVTLAALGFGYLAFAWANVASAVIGSALSFWLWRDRSIYRFSLSDWRGVIRFGLFDSATALIAGLGESAPYLVLGKMLDSWSLGMAQRAVLLSRFPERVVLAGVGAVALTTFSRLARERRELRGAYLAAIELMTVVQWPALILMGLLAAPLVTLLFGQRWLEVAPLLRIMSAAFAFAFPGSLQYPVFVAVGAVRFLPPLAGLQAALNLIAIGWFARYGLIAAAWSLLIAIPMNSIIAIAAVRYYINFSWADFFCALRGSAIVALLSAAGPMAVVLGVGATHPLGLVGAAIAGVLSAVGWGCGLWITGHPILREMARARAALRKTQLAVRILGALGIAAVILPRGD